MKHITFYLDFVSPYAWLAFDALPEALMGCSHTVTYKPVLLGALFKHHGQTSPADVAAKHAWILRHVRWLAARQSLPLEVPAAHPFNPLPLLRLAVACQAQGEPNRYVCEAIFRHAWEGGGDAVAPERLQALQDRLAPVQDPAGDDVKAQLRAHTEEALALGVFGVPTCVADGQPFWGLDALPMLRDHVSREG